MSPAPPTPGTFSVTRRGRPRIVIGTWPTPEANQTGAPPVPTDSAMVSSCGRQSGEHTHTALLSEVGSIREYILVMFSHTIVAAGWPDSAATCTIAGLVESWIEPAGSPTPEPVRKARSSAKLIAA